MKPPPERSGITFEVGAQLEARDRHKNWYTASIEKIDYEKEQVLIHYRQWSRRHDEWFPWNSPYLRPLERISLRKQGLKQSRPQPMFGSGTKVLACWTDCRFYPAKVIRVNKDDSYTVRFYDGVVMTVKPTKIKPFKEKRKTRPEKSVAGSEGWEEGESEEEEGAEREEEKSENMSAEEEEEERKRKAEPSPSDPPAKKKTDERSSVTSDPPLMSSNINDTQNQPTTVQPDLPSSALPDRDVLLERQAHLPTTHKYSREPLYRVIKNQPPPILSIELDHNPFKCPAPGCTKSYRKGSLLHYHIKYYHSDQQLEEQCSEQETSKRQSLLEGQDLPLERRKENQNNIAMKTGVKKEGGKERRNFLRIKLKKKKKKKKKRSISGHCSSDDESPTHRPPITLKLSARYNTHTQDEGSDWSTVTAESEEDMAYWPLSTETEDCEVVRCVCEVDEENDFMIQCELCQFWQHGTCMGLYEDNVPHSYICYCCRNTTGWRRAQYSLTDPDWLTSGHMFGLSCVRENYSEVNASKISHTRHLLAHTEGLNQVLRGLQLKISILHAISHPDLQMWRLPWRHEVEPAAPANQGREAAGRTNGTPPVCYVSSEHCYQRTGASWVKEEENDNESQTTGPDQNPDRKVETPGGLDKTYHIQTDTVKHNTGTLSHTNTDTETNTDTHTDKVTDTVIPVHIKTETLTDTDQHTDTYTEKSTHSLCSPARASVVECQLNLLAHIETLHNQITTRMDLVERELDVLESWLDHSGELEPPDPLSRLPQLKQRIRQLLCDLGIVRRLSVCW
ncbi:PHD finger protein 20-like [Lampris incognitus]|uniref:PHD finger protein 20-like n=1 Tax=Lampris incognitus TaxID=2546036 RepID=UPI0024B492C2|nr:PHD finger protein 20-like [Lampris incognitus]